MTVQSGDISNIFNTLRDFVPTTMIMPTRNSGVPPLAYILPKYPSLNMDRKCQMLCDVIEDVKNILMLNLSLISTCSTPYEIKNCGN